MFTSFPVAFVGGHRPHLRRRDLRSPALVSPRRKKAAGSPLQAARNGGRAPTPASRCRGVAAAAESGSCCGPRSRVAWMAGTGGIWLRRTDGAETGTTSPSSPLRQPAGMLVGHAAPRVRMNDAVGRRLGFVGTAHSRVSSAGCPGARQSGQVFAYLNDLVAYVIDPGRRAPDRFQLISRQLGCVRSCPPAAMSTSNSCTTAMPPRITPEGGRSGRPRRARGRRRSPRRRARRPAPGTARTRARPARRRLPVRPRSARVRSHTVFSSRPRRSRTPARWNRWRTGRWLRSRR